MRIPLTVGVTLVKDGYSVEVVEVTPHGVIVTFPGDDGFGDHISSEDLGNWEVS
jgi:hypothetical protein